MWYNRHIINISTLPTCSQCESPLIFVSKVTEKTEGSLFPQTTTIYTCSNIPCREETDRETVKRIKLREDRKLAEEKRFEVKLQQKNDAKRIREANA